MSVQTPTEMPTSLKTQRNAARKIVFSGEASLDEDLQAAKFHVLGVQTGRHSRYETLDAKILEQYVMDDVTLLERLAQKVAQHKERKIAELIAKGIETGELQP